jgi:phage protein
MKKYTDKMIEFLRKIASGKTYIEITEVFNKRYKLGVTPEKIKSLLSRKKICTGTRGCLYKKGSIPWNKGTKGLTKANKTSFKKGERPKNWKPVGSERVDRDGYTLIKISNEGSMWQRWALKHKVLWEKYNNRKIPKGYAVLFADQDKQNFSEENLILVSKNELRILNQNGLIKANAELTKSGIAVAKLKAKLAEIRKEKK